MFHQIFAVLLSPLAVPSSQEALIDRPCARIEATLASPALATRTLFGTAVAFDGASALVGAPQDGEAGISAGAVHVFEETDLGWTATAKLGPGSADAGDAFGRSLALTERYLAVGASSDENPDGVKRGSVTIFRRDGERWMPEATLFPSEGDANSRFGWSVAAWGPRVVVGAPGDIHEVDGRAFVYVRAPDGWRLEQQLRPLQGRLQGDFGFSVAIEDDWIVVGAPLSERTTFYRFQASGEWSAWQEFDSPAISATHAFGYAVKLQGATALVGEPMYPSAQTPTGAAHVYERTGDAWALETTLEPEYFMQAIDFGGSLDIEGERLLVGTADLTGFFSPNGLIQFRRSGAAWGTGVAIVPAALPITTVFSTAIAIAGDRALAGMSQVSNDPEMVWILALGEQSVAPVRTRNAGTNVLALRAEPVSIGAELHLEVDLPPGYSTARILAFDSVAEVPLGNGRVLLAIDGGSGTLVDVTVFSGAPRVSLPIPAVVELVSIELHAQASLRGGALPFLLTNAQDIVVGTCACP